MPIEETGFRVIFILVATLVGVIFVLFSLLWVGWKEESIRGDRCPYTNAPMLLGIDIAKTIAKMVNVFLAEHPSEDNPPINFEMAAYCSETGRIFPNCVTSSEKIRLSWDFISARASGTFVSWGSISEEERGVVRLLHDSLEGFQTEKSSMRLKPQDVEEEYARLSPGPLYIDRRTRILMGWKRVPGTRFEVLIVQRPKFQSLEETL
jgi:hypothetical protein